MRDFVSGTPSYGSDSKTGIVSGLRAGGDGFLAVRSKPKGRKLGELYNGDKVAILGQRGAWYKVRTSSGLVGWSHGDWVSVNGGKIKKNQKNLIQYLKNETFQEEILSILVIGIKMVLCG